MDWERDLPDWPLSAHSRRIRHRPHDWHVQELGEGPILLLLHGAGATTHTWRDLIPTLAQTHHVIALDLPGHGFTQAGSRFRLGLERTADDIAALSAAEGWCPSAIIGHSAGGAVALELSLRLTTPDSTPPKVIGINAALDRFEGMAGWLFPMLAKFLAMNPLTAMAFAAGGGRPDRARNVIRSTGSKLTDEGLAYYNRLLSDRAHVDGTLQMMAAWNTDGIWDRMPQVTAPCLLITGESDGAVPPSVSDRAAARLPNAEVQKLDGLGHLAHEEAPTEVTKIILDWLEA
ncbi:alpha/beta fold hydrolase BchO [Roseovarius rhodophyticola]|uniref:Alpha/beta fold hydrolase BchO n=1 Tax=Roseovarius rhodophyticola TaxID=3080827 RepID=A0ABZ2TCB5_9RHOB|nr:alpha/beta fold hydrolase BchO [Roseovarius sp. W115]MDV2931089.1 alpha/beta fold hydrolase [Roseovarius sp. W115]